jgi:hypothetical protein
MSVWQQQKLRRNAKHNECQRRKWQSVVWNSCTCNVKKVNILLKSANFYWLYDLESSMLLQLRSQKRQQRQMTTQKRVAFSESHSWKCTRCDKSWKKFENRWTVFFTMSTLINKKSYAHTLYNTECLFYEIITSCFTRNHNLQCMKIRSHMITDLMNLQIHQ